MEFSKVNTSVAKCQGNIGVARAIYEYAKMGYTVLAPLSDSDKYDLVVDIDGVLNKVQVKTSRCKSASGKYSVNLKTGGGNTKTNTIRNRSSDDYDLLFVLLETGRCWSIPTTELGNVGTSVIVEVNKYTQYEIK